MNMEGGNLAMDNGIREIIENVQNGDQAAFGEIVRRFQARLRVFVRVLLWDPNQVDDLTQQAFITAYTRIDTYDPTRAEFYFWLKGIARNLAVNANRRWQTRKEFQKDYLAELRIETGNDTSEKGQALLDNAIERLRTCFQRLPPKLQELFRAFYDMGKRGAEIAAEYNTSESAVKMSLLRGRLALKECMEGIREKA